MFTGESTFQGFLGGAKWISSIHSLKLIGDREGFGSQDWTHQPWESVPNESYMVVNVNGCVFVRGPPQNGSLTLSLQSTKSGTSKKSDPHG